jgi:hypothetical protein
MDNPWRLLPETPPFVLQCDRAEVDEFNFQLPQDSPFRLRIDDLIPEPFIGAVTTAPVIVLQLNPGCGKTTAASHADPAFRQSLLANLRHEPSESPFYFLDPRFRRHDGRRWWEPKLRKLSEVVSFDQLSRGLAVVEWFPYKSTKFKHGCRTASQEYGFALVRSAIERNALIVVSRSVRRWEKSVPELCTYRKKLTLSSTRNVALTPNNLKYNSVKCPEAWRMLVDAIRSGG